VNEEIEDVESFRLRARHWIRANLPPLSGRDWSRGQVQFNDEAWARARGLQKVLYEGGYAGLCYPKEYGGLTPAHQSAFTDEVAEYEMPLVLNTPTFTICGPTILELGTEEQKRRYLPAIIRGAEIWVQFLSEPVGGSDLAGAVTRADRDGESFVLNGSKVWSSGAYAADYALCLARTDWEVPKHRGLTMFILRTRQPGVEIRRVRQVNGGTEFCEEFFTNVHVAAEDVLGQVNCGWTVATKQLSYERIAVGGGSQYASGRQLRESSDRSYQQLIEIARRAGQADNSHIRELIAESYAIAKIHSHLVERVVSGMQTGNLPSQAGAIIRLYRGESGSRATEIALEIAGPGAVAFLEESDSGREIGDGFVARQAGSLGGGSTEMAANIISERVLGMPREYAPDHDVPFSEVKRSRR